MELKNKKVCFLGDSITAGCGTSAEECRYTNVFARKTGAVIQVNGISGTRIAKQTKQSEWEQHDRYYIPRVDELETDADVVVVFGGTNDFGHGDAPFGTMADRDDTTFCGAMHVMLEKLINRFPAATIVLLTPLHRPSENDPVNEIGIERPLLCEYVAAEKAIAAEYSVPVLDLWSVSGMQPCIPVQKELYMPDGLHPNDRGAERIADLLIAFLKANF